MNREIYLKNVAESLAFLSRQVEVLNAVNLYDINNISEDFYAKLLNIIFDYNLINANTIKKNIAGIDLIDINKRISIQVTSDNSSKKIKHTIEEFISNNSYENYDRLIILILTKKKNYKTTFDTQNKFNFDEESDVYDIEDLIKYIRGLDTEKIKKINEFLQTELCDKVYNRRETQATEIETIIDLIEFISKHKKVKKTIEPVVDPEFKIYKRFREFADKLLNDYKELVTLYNNALIMVYETLGIDEAMDIIIMIFLQDISIQFLDETNNDPVLALNKLVTYFESELSVNGKKYDRAAIKFYLINEMIKCRVFPNERDEYNGSKHK